LKAAIRKEETAELLGAVTLQSVRCMHKLREDIFRMRDHLMMSRHDFEDEAYEDSPEYEHGETVGDIWAGNYPQLRCRTRMSIACDDVSDSIWAAVCEEGVTPLSVERLVFTMLRKLN
jgi:hypothetical protein